MSKKARQHRKNLTKAYKRLAIKIREPQFNWRWLRAAVRLETTYQSERGKFKEQMKIDYYKNLEKFQSKLNKMTMKEVWKYYNNTFKKKVQCNIPITTPEQKTRFTSFYRDLYRDPWGRQELQVAIQELDFNYDIPSTEGPTFEEFMEILTRINENKAAAGVVRPCIIRQGGIWGQQILFRILRKIWEERRVRDNTVLNESTVVLLFKGG